METQWKHATHGLKTGTFLAFADGEGVVLCCTIGGVWISQEGGARDLRLAAGERFVSDRAGSLSIYAYEPTVLESKTQNVAALPSRPTVSLWTRLKRVVRRAGGNKDSGQLNWR